MAKILSLFKLKVTCNLKNLKKRIISKIYYFNYQAKFDKKNNKCMIYEIYYLPIN